MSVSAEEIEKALRSAGVRQLPSGIEDRFLTYLDLLTRWNARMNLTSVRVPKEIVDRHFVESALVAQHLPYEIATLLDFGSGAGFPGIPIALCRPEIRVTLGESQSKKAAFLREAVRTLQIAAEVYGGRIEDLPPERSFDAVILRAVERMPAAIAVAAPRARRMLALVVAAADAVQYQECAPEFTWTPEIPLGAVGRATLLLGERRGFGEVPRGTI